MNNIYNYFRNLDKDNLSFLYNGFIDDEFTEEIIRIVEKNIEKSEEPNAFRNKVSFLIAEAFQNIVKHADIDDKTAANKIGIFTIRNIGNTYYIGSANLIENSNIDYISSKLLEINSSDKDSLKEQYLKIMNNNEFSDKGGAGLGLIQIANKSGNQIEYDFEKIDEKYSLFYLQIKLKSKKVTNIESDDLLISEVVELNNLMKKNNTYLAYKGDFSHDNVLTLLKIIERNLQVNLFEYSGLKSNIYNILTEMLQNISKHAYSTNNKKEGIFVIGKLEDKYNISTGNFIKNSEIEFINNLIFEINSKDKIALKKMYLDKIKLGIIDDQGNAGLGFIDIARSSSDPIKFEILEVNNKCSFLAITINI